MPLSSTRRLVCSRSVDRARCRRRCRRRRDRPPTVVARPPVAILATTTLATHGRWTTPVEVGSWTVATAAVAEVVVERATPRPDRQLGRVMLPNPCAKCVESGSAGAARWTRICYHRRCQHQCRRPHGDWPQSGSWTRAPVA